MLALKVPPAEPFAVKPLYALARFGKWDEILKEPAPPAQLRYATGVWHYARGLAFAAGRKYDSAGVELDSLAAIAKRSRTRSTQASIPPNRFWRRERHLAAAIAEQQGKHDEAIRRSRRASRSRMS